MTSGWSGAWPRPAGRQFFAWQARFEPGTAVESQHGAFGIVAGSGKDAVGPAQALEVASAHSFAPFRFAEREDAAWFDGHGWDGDGDVDLQGRAGSAAADGAGPTW